MSISTIKCLFFTNIYFKNILIFNIVLKNVGPPSPKKIRHTSGPLRRNEFPELQVFNFTCSHETQLIIIVARYVRFEIRVDNIT